MATAVLEVLGTPIIFKETGGNVALSLKNVANGAGRISARADLGAFPRTTRFRAFATNQCQATPTPGNLIRYYLAPWDDDATAGRPWGRVGSIDAAFTIENELRNLKYLGSIQVDSTTTNAVLSTGFEDVVISTRYVSVVVWNASGASLTNDASVHQFILTPIYTEIQ